MPPEHTTEEFVFWVNPLSQRELSSHSCSLIPQCDAARSVAAGDPKKRLMSRLSTFPRKGPWRAVDLRVQLWAWVTLKEGLGVTDLTFRWASTRRPITGGHVVVGLAAMKGRGSWLGGGSALAAPRPWGQAGLRAMLAQKAGDRPGRRQMNTLLVGLRDLGMAFP